MDFTIEFDREGDGRWIAEVMEIPGAMAYGVDRDDAAARAQGNCAPDAGGPRSPLCEALHTTPPPPPK